MNSAALTIVLALTSAALWAQTPPSRPPASGGGLVIHPAPDGEELSTDYAVEVNGRPVPVYTARVNDPPLEHLDHGGTYSFAYFDFSGRVTVRIRSLDGRFLQSARIRPLSKRIAHSLIDTYSTTFTLSEPAQLSFEPGGRRRPLLIFANPLETDPPKEGDPDVIYFGPGVHQPEGGVIALKSNQTLYLAGGAVVKAAVTVEDAENVAIRGRGILCANSWKWRQGPARRFVGLRGSRQVTIEGIILRGSYAWTLVPENCEHITITNLKICGGRAWNDDGINPCNTRHLHVRDSFIRSDDDCMALKGLRSEWGDVDDIRVERTVLWCDRARVILMGHESLAANMQNITYRDIDVIHFVQTPFLLEPGDEMNLQNVTFEDFRIEGVGQQDLIRIRPVINQYVRTNTPGHVRDIRFKDVRVSGDTGEYRIFIDGHDARHQTERVTFENFTIGGEPLTMNSPHLCLGQHTAGIEVARPGPSVALESR